MGGGGSNYINYQDYNALGQLTRVYTENGTGTVLVHITYEYDKNSNMTQETNLLDNSYTTYEYDTINQLTAEKYYNTSGTLVQQITHKYEIQYGGLLGNRTERIVTEGGTSTTTTYRYNAANELTSTSAGPYSFDANGNMTQGSRTLCVQSRKTAYTDQRQQRIPPLTGSIVKSFIYIIVS